MCKDEFAQVEYRRYMYHPGNLTFKNISNFLFSCYGTLTVDVVSYKGQYTFTSWVRTYIHLCVFYAMAGMLTIKPLYTVDLIGLDNLSFQSHLVIFTYAQSNMVLHVVMWIIRNIRCKILRILMHALLIFPLFPQVHLAPLWICQLFNWRGNLVASQVEHAKICMYVFIISVTI